MKRDANEIGLLFCPDLRTTPDHIWRYVAYRTARQKDPRQNG